MALVACVAGSSLGCGGGGRPVPDSVASDTPAPPPVQRTADTDRDRDLGLDLVERLRRGGLVLYIRHTATESTQDDPAPDLTDPSTQRNLSAAGREQARQIGRAVRRLEIPIGQVLVSPYNRTRETAELAFGKGRARQARELINEIFPGTDDEELARSLRRLLRRSPDAGSNTVLVSHGFNLTGATGLSSAEGDTVIFDPGGEEPLTPVARIGADEWRSMQGPKTS